MPAKEVKNVILALNGVLPILIFKLSQKQNSYDSR